jgi:hypothetical protein
MSTPASLQMAREEAEAWLLARMEVYKDPAKPGAYEATKDLEFVKDAVDVLMDYRRDFLSQQGPTSELVTYAKGAAAIIETILNGQYVPPENMQHAVEGIWKSAKAQHPNGGPSRLLAKLEYAKDIAVHRPKDFLSLIDAINECIEMVRPLPNAPTPPTR